MLGSVNNSDVDLLRLEALRLSALWRLNVSAPLAAPVAPESSSAVREGADETIGVPAIFPQMQLKVLNIDAVVRSHGLDVSAVKVGVTDVRGVEGNDKCCELLVAEDQHEGGEKGAVNGGIDVDDTVNTSIRAQGRGESTGGCLDHVGMDRHGCERSSNVDTERINIGFKMNENDDISNLDEMSNNLNLNYDESIDDCRDMSVTHRITIDGIVHSNQSAKINTANSKNATSSNHDDDGRGVAKRARLTPPSSDQNHAVAIADATTSFLTRLTQNDSSLSTTASVVVVDTICSSSSSSMPRVDATTRDLLRLQAREQLLAREQELAHKIEVQRVRNEIKRAEALLSFQSSKLAKARKVHENLCLVEKDQYRLLSSLRKTKQQLLQRSAKVRSQVEPIYHSVLYCCLWPIYEPVPFQSHDVALYMFLHVICSCFRISSPRMQSSLYRIEMMADVSSARFVLAGYLYADAKLWCIVLAQLVAMLMVPIGMDIYCDNTFILHC